MILDIGAVLRRIGACEGTELRRRHGHRTAAAEKIIERDTGLADQRRVHGVERLHPRYLVDRAQLQMVLQILADAGSIEQRCNSMLRQVRPGPDGRQHQQLRRADRARRQDHLAAAFRTSQHTILPPAHAGRTFPCEVDAFGEAAGFKPEILPVQHRLQETARGGPAPAHLLIDVEIADAFVVAGVEVRDGRDAVLVRRFATSVENFPGQPRLLDAPFAALCVMPALEKMIDVLAEERPHVVPRPAGQAELAPLVVVGGLAEHVDHAVDRRRAADHLAARIVQRTAIETRLRLGLEQPVGARIADGIEIADRDVKPDPVVVAAGLQQQNALRWIGRQPVRQHAAGRARADDDKVELALDRRRCRHCLSPLRQTLP